MHSPLWGIPSLYRESHRQTKLGHQEHSAGVQPRIQADAETKEERYAVDCSGLDVEQYNKLSLEISFI